MSHVTITGDFMFPQHLVVSVPEYVGAKNHRNCGHVHRRKEAPGLKPVAVVTADESATYSAFSAATRAHVADIHTGDKKNAVLSCPRLRRQDRGHFTQFLSLAVSPTPQVSQLIFISNASPPLEMGK